MAKRTYYDTERQCDIYVAGNTGDETIKLRLRTMQGDEYEEYEVSLIEFLSRRFAERTGSLHE